MHLSPMVLGAQHLIIMNEVIHYYQELISITHWLLNPILNPKAVHSSLCQIKVRFTKQSKLA